MTGKTPERGSHGDAGTGNDDRGRLPAAGGRMSGEPEQRPPRRPDVFARAFVNALAIAAGLTILLGWAF